jgi:hypothetical protein
MGYQTTIYLLGVTIAPAQRTRAEELLKKQRRETKSKLSQLARLVAFTSDGTLEFRNKALPIPGASEVPDDEGFVLSALGKWYQAEELARWLCFNGFSGSVIQHSCEGDGAAWGWEFKSGRIRTLGLVPITRWQHLRPRRRDTASGGGKSRVNS